MTRGTDGNMSREMRRKEKEMDISEAKVLLGDAEVGRLVMSLRDEPYVIPVNFVYFQDRVYFHCAREGQKIDYLSANPRVCFEVDEFLGVKPSRKPCSFGSKYRSVIVFGKAEFVENVDEKKLALRKLVEKYAKTYTSFDEDAFEKTMVVAIIVERLTGKKSV